MKSLGNSAQRRHRASGASSSFPLASFPTARRTALEFSVLTHPESRLVQNYQFWPSRRSGWSTIHNFTPPAFTAALKFSILTRPDARVPQNSQFHPGRVSGWSKILKFTPPGSAARSKSRILPRPRSIFDSIPAICAEYATWPAAWTAATRRRFPTGRHVSQFPSAVMPAHSTCAFPNCQLPTPNS